MDELVAKNIPAGDTRYIGKRVTRSEDEKLLKGQGSYIDDMHLRDMLQGAVLRSPHAHATIVSIDCSQAKALEGVHAVYVHADLPERARGRVPSKASGMPTSSISSCVHRTIISSARVCGCRAT